MRVVELELKASPSQRAHVMPFYLGDLGFKGTADGAIRIGESRLRFSVAEVHQEPFYHYAFLVPGNRFRPACEWLKTKASLQ